MKKMEYKYLLDIGLIILVVKIFTLITQKVKMPKVLGGLIAGIVLGPAMLDIVQNNTILEALSKFGIILIMFLAGMETSIKKFISNSNKYVIIATLGVIVPLVLGTIFSLIYIQDLKTNLFFGAVITATSVSITVETLIEMKKIKSNVGLAILGAGVVDDIIGVLFLTIVMNSGNLQMSTFAIMILKIVLFFGMAIILGLLLFKVFEKIEKKDVKNEQMPTYSIAFALILAYIAEMLGVSGIVGAYIAGLVIGNTEKGRKVKGKIDLVVHMIFSPIFFASVGLNLGKIDFEIQVWIFILIFTTITIISKVIGNGLGAKLCGYSNEKALQIGIGMATRGEVALIISAEAQKIGLINEEIFSIVIITVLLVTFITPILLHYSFEKKVNVEEQ
ncbi:MAG: cation:proton antiporter [Clostridia bacterium]|nr:cation:proton antiporter [Clostridia bacterium]